MAGDGARAARRWRRVAVKLQRQHPTYVGQDLPLGNKANPYDEGVYIQLTTMTRSQEAIATAYDGLRSLCAGRGWAALLEVERAEIDSVLAPLGLVQRRATSLLGFIEAVERDHDGSLRWLATVPAEEAVRQLERLPGLGPKSARCVAGYSLGLDVLAVDVHVLRVAKRLGFIDRDLTWGRAHLVLEEQVPASLRRELHVLLVVHGRDVCTNRAPACGTCLLARSCPERGRTDPSRAAYVPELRRSRSS